LHTASITQWHRQFKQSQAIEKLQHPLCRSTGCFSAVQYVAPGPLRHFAALQQTVAFRGIATLTPATLPTGGGSTGGSTGGSKGG